MVTVCASSACAVLLLSPEEWISPGPALRLTLREAGLAPWKDMELRLFERSGQGLLIACPLSPLCLRSALRPIALRRSHNGSKRAHPSG